MEFRLTPEQQQLENKIRNYMEEIVPPERREYFDIEGHSEVSQQTMRKIGEDGWLGIGWPKEYGGQDLSPIEQYIFFDLALGYYWIPLHTLTINAVGPTIMLGGTEEQKKEILPRILKADIMIAIGYTEPEAGSDLASLRTTAVRDGDDYIINGQKIFTTQAELSEYIWLAARTDPEVKKHKGISMFLVETKTPGITIEPMITMSDLQTNTVFLDNVRVPKEALIGGENNGWLYINHQLARERIAMVPHSAPLRFIDILLNWIKEAKLEDNPLIRNKLAEMAVDAEVVKLLNYRVAWMMTKGENPHSESAMMKVFGTEQIKRMLYDALEIMGPYGQLVTGSKWVPNNGLLERWLRSKMVLTFGGGASEILRDTVATMGLGLPRGR